MLMYSVVTVVVQSPSHAWLFATPWTTAHQPFLSFTISRVCSDSCPLNWWCHPIISSFIAPFSSCPQSFPASGWVFSNELDFASGGQSIGASASVPQMNIQDYIPLGLTGLISLLSRRLSSLQFPAYPDETGNFTDKVSKQSQVKGHQTLL